ncbi:MAG: hypothetical protein F083_2264 [bacterium F083]|nr:MAG: hypothetical protein F083_2264 [bacterium F083]
MAKVDFKSLKEKVGVDDIAYSLGYRVNRKAGLGKYLEMALVDERGKHIDSIVIRHPKDKASQSYFRHNGRGGGDVIAFIMENIGSFSDTGINEWDKLGHVLSRFADEPVEETSDGKYLERMGFKQEKFDPSRYEVQPITEHLKNGMNYMLPRGFSEDTVKTFAPYIVRLMDKKSANFKDFNLGFPYREPGKDEVVGYEIRGYNKFKSKATGTNSTTAAWLVDMSSNENPMAVRNVYFGESAYDIMAFWQANRLKLDKESSVFVSIGGTFSDLQLSNIMKYYERANAVDCFDNDIAGRIYSLRMASVLGGRHLNIVKTDDFVMVSADGKEVKMSHDDTTLAELSKHFRIPKRLSQWKPPKTFKDWNDVIMNKPFVQTVELNKFQRNQALEERRTKGIKI